MPPSSYSLYVAIYRNPICDSAFQWHIAGTELEITLHPSQGYDDIVYVDAKTLCLSNKTLVMLRELSYHWRYLYEREVPPGRRDDDPTIEFTPAFLQLRKDVSSLMCIVDKAVNDYLSVETAKNHSSLSTAPLALIAEKN